MICMCVCACVYMSNYNNNNNNNNNIIYVCVYPNLAALNFVSFSYKILNCQH